MFKRRFILVTVLFTGCHRTRAAEYWDAQFGVPGAAGVVGAVTVFRDRVVIAGNFISISGIPATNLAQWDGTNWSPVGGGVQGLVNTLASCADNLFVGGLFSQIGDLQVNNVAKWDGTNWSRLGEGVDNSVFALATGGTNLYAGGRFKRAGTNQVGKVARWDGRNWSGLGRGILDVSTVGRVFSLAVAGDSLYAAGIFRAAGDSPATNIARWDGSVWHELGNGLRNFDYSGAENGDVRALAFRRGVLFAGGSFRLAGTIAATNVAGWDGAQWLDLARGVDDLASVESLTFSGGELFAGGGFRSIGGVAANRVAGWNGVAWLPLGSGVSQPGALSGDVLGLTSTGSELVAVGSFTAAGGQPATNIALWHIPHQLGIERANREMKLSWPGTGSNFVLETCSSISQAVWQSVPRAPNLENEEWVVTNALSPANEFYRLRRR